MASLGGSVAYLPGQKGAAFRVTLPLRLDERAVRGPFTFPKGVTG